MTTVNPSNGNETNPNIFIWDIQYSNLTFLIGHKTLKCFDYFNNWHLKMQIGILRFPLHCKSGHKQVK